MLRWRLALGFLFGFAIAGLCWLDMNGPEPGAFLAPLAVLIAVLGASELFNMLAEREIWPARTPVIVGLIAVILAPWLGPKRFDPARGLDVAFAALVLAMMAVFIVEMSRYRKPGGVSEKLGGAALVLVYIGGLMAFVVALRVNFHIAALASLIVVTKMGDIGAYTIGRIFGKRKLIPRLSPGKTWEGVYGALVFACAGAWIADTWLAPKGGQGYWWIVFGLLVGTAGILGDLAESLIKRDLGRKDSSTWMPGFGGVLDLLDSILFAAPVAYLCWRFELMGDGMIR